MTTTRHMDRCLAMMHVCAHRAEDKGAKMITGSDYSGTFYYLISTFEQAKQFDCVADWPIVLDKAVFDRVNESSENGIIVGVERYYGEVCMFYRDKDGTTHAFNMYNKPFKKDDWLQWNDIDHAFDCVKRGYFHGDVLKRLNEERQRRAQAAYKGWLKRKARLDAEAKKRSDDIIKH